MKTATDPFAQYIDRTPHPTTIADLVALPYPRREAGARINGVETTTWVLTNVALLEWKRETDQDYHVVESDGRFTMIVEIPDPACVGSNSVVADGIASSRQTFETHVAGGAGGTGHTETISVAGVGFFDHPHNQTGAAFNQIELHPVTAICFGRDCKLDLSAAATTQAQTEEQVRERERQAALQADIAALCRSRNTAQRTVDRYQQFLASCRAMLGVRPSDCTGEHEKAADAQVRDAIIQVNEDENLFLRKWGGEAFITAVCR